VRRLGDAPTKPDAAGSKARHRCVLFDVGASTDLGSIGISKITGFISVNATASKGDGNYQAVTVGIRASL
jgi:hypothetical protein